MVRLRSDVPEYLSTRETCAHREYSTGMKSRGNLSFDSAERHPSVEMARSGPAIAKVDCERPEAKFKRTRASSCRALCSDQSISRRRR
jgi:hypothetical protein